MRLALAALMLFLAGGMPAASAPGAMEQAWSRNLKEGDQVTAGPVAYPARVGAPARAVALAINNQLELLDGQGRPRWSRDLGGTPERTLAVADLDGDGDTELVAAVGEEVVCVRGDGTVAWRSPLGTGTTGGPACGDLAGDARPEVVVSTGDGGLVCLDGAGRPRWRLLAESAHRPVSADPFISRLNWNYERYLNRDATVPPTIGDVDGDGAAEVLLGTEPGYLYCISGRGEWKWQVKAGGAITGAPVICDLEGDGQAEVVMGSQDRRVYVLEGASGRVRARADLCWGVTASLAVADLDGDGTQEVIASDGRAGLYCLQPDGRVQWQLALKTGRKTSETGDQLLAPPAIADVDGDGKLELVVGMRSREVLTIVSAQGEVKATYPLEQATEKLLADSGVWETPVVADLDGDGKLEVVAATRLVALRGLRAGGQAGAVAWSGTRGTPGLGGCLLARPGGSGRPVARLAGEQAGEEISLAPTPQDLVAGVLPARIRHPRFASRPAVLLTRLTMAAGVEEVRIDQVLSAEERFGIAVPVEGDWPRRVECTLVSLQGRVVAPQAVAIPCAAAEARRQVHEQAVAVAGKAVSALGLDWQSGEELLQGRLGRRDEAGQPLSEMALAAAEASLAGKLPVVVNEPPGKPDQPVFLYWWAGDPWEAFAPAQAWPAGGQREGGVTIALYQREAEAGAVNLLNLSARPLPVQVRVGELKTPEGALLAPTRLELRQTTMVPRYTGEMVGDALVKLGEGALIEIPPLRAAQLFVTVQAKDTPPGVYRGQLTLSELRVGGQAVAVPLQVKVWPLALPERSPVRFCTWAYLDNDYPSLSLDPARDHKDRALADLVAHGNNVFTFSLGTTAACDQQGRLDPVDWRELDRRVARYRRHGIMLLHGWELPQERGGKPVPEAAYERAFAEWMRQLAGHLGELGAGYEDWAIYIMDEPGLDHGPRIRFVMEYGRRIKEADPRIQIYTDPVLAMGLDELAAAAPYIDIWCPEQDSFYRLWGETADMHSAERLAIMQGDSKQVWTYECFPRVKKMSPLGYYRHQAWLAWQQGITGLGFWTYGTDPNSPWRPGKDEYVLVYPGRDGPIPSKRWEACRDGVEDYGALWLAQQAVAQALARGKPGAQAAQAELAQLVDRVVAERAVLPTLQRARERIAQITLAMQEPARP